MLTFYFFPLLHSVDISPDRSTFVTSSCDNHVCLWDLKSNELVTFFESHTDSVNVVRFVLYFLFMFFLLFMIFFFRYFPSGTAVCSGSDDLTCRLFDIRANAELMQYKDTSLVTSLTFSKSGRFLFSSHDDPIIRVWDALKGEKVGQLKGHSDHVNSLDMSPDGLALASGSWDNSVKVCFHFLLYNVIMLIFFIKRYLLKFA